ncbi:unnamed protein product [Leptidea sinapis]|uniref:Uncharacterized protein n=1 Tax=Leptidea sinapis TaxID=189913 RepID=A0A5E4R412_9NEOP|nr:unnamed protein product [Leptidea sinapis]
MFDYIINIYNKFHCII